MKAKMELREFIRFHYERASKINHFSFYIGWSEQNELIRTAKRHRKMIIQKESPAFHVHCKDEETGEIIWAGISKNYSLEEIILILIAEKFYMTRQQIRKFIKL